MAGKVTYSIVADDEKAKRQINRFFYNMEKQSKQANSRLGRLNQQFKDMGKNIKRYAIGAGVFGGIAASARLAYSAVNKMNEEIERAGDLSQQFASGTSKLLQLADTPEEMRKMTKQVTRTQKEQGVAAQDAGEFVFKLHSADIANKRKELAQLLPITEKPGQIVTGIGGMMAAFGEEKTRGPVSMAGKIVAGAQQSPVGSGKMGKYAPRVAGFAAPIGATDEEVLASLAQTAEPIGGIEEAHTAVKAFARQLGKKGITEGGLIQNVRRIKEKNLGPERLSDYLGSSEAVQGYRQMANLLPDIRQHAETLQQVEKRAGTEQGKLASRENIMKEGAPHLWSQYKLKRAKQKEQVQLREQQGERATNIEEKFTDTRREIRENQGSWGWVFASPAIKLARLMERIETDATPGSKMEKAQQLMQKGLLFDEPEEGEQQKTRESMEELKKSVDENTQAQREKTTGETVPDEQTGAEPVNN